MGKNVDIFVGEEGGLGKQLEREMHLGKGKKEDGVDTSSKYKKFQNPFVGSRTSLFVFYQIISIYFLFYLFLVVVFFQFSFTRKLSQNILTK